MTLSSTLWSSIAALDRIAPDHHPDFEAQGERDHWSSEKIPYADPAVFDHRYALHDDEKFIRLSTSTASSLPYLRRSRSQPSLRSSQYLPEKGSARMPPSEIEDEPKLTLRYVASVTLALLPAFFALCIPAIGIIIIGLAADSIAWGTQAATVAKTIFVGPYNETTDDMNHWWTRMIITPTSYDTHTFSYLIVAGTIAAICGTAAIALSVVSRSSGGRIELGHKTVLSKRILAMARVVIEAFAFIATIVILISVRSLYYPTSYDSSDRDGSIYELQPEYLDPPLPADHVYPDPNGTWSRELVDDVLRLYRSPNGVQYSPLSWSCRMSGHVDQEYSMGDRYWQVCQEGDAARWMLVVLLLLQGIVLAKHALDWKSDRGGASWASQRLSSEERVARSEERE